MSRIWIKGAVFSALLTAGMAWAAAPQGGKPADGKAAAAKPRNSQVSQRPLNRNEILSLYMSGEFETLVALLENVRRERYLRDREDSVFIYKFLGVIYGANESTKKKAESFLYQMLKLDPAEDLSSLGVGDSVEAIFGRVRTRYSKMHMDSLAAAGKGHGKIATVSPVAPAPTPFLHGGALPPAAPAEKAASAPASAASAESGRRPMSKWVWVAGGGAVAAAAVTGIILLNQGSENRVHTIADTLR